MPPLPAGKPRQAPRPVELPPYDDESTFSFAALRGQLQSLGLEAPTAVTDRGDLVALVQEVRRDRGDTGGATGSRATTPAALADRLASPAADRSVAELKSRLKEL